MTLRVESLAKTRNALEENAVSYAEPQVGVLRVSAEDTCGVTLQYVESLRA